MNRTEVALDIWRFAALYQRMPGLSRSKKVLVRDWALITAAAVMGQPTTAGALRVGRSEAALLVDGLVEALDAAGITRSDVADMFNRAVRTPPAHPTVVSVEDVGLLVPTGHLLIHEDALRRLVDAGAGETP
jgi:hypothetical protein